MWTECPEQFDWDGSPAATTRDRTVTSPGNRLVRTMCMYGSHVMKTLRQKEKYDAKAELDLSHSTRWS